MIKVLLWLRNVTANTRQGGQTTIPYPAVTVLPAPETVSYTHLTLPTSDLV